MGSCIADVCHQTTHGHQPFVVPDVITTVAAIIGVGGMIYGVATGVLIVFNRDPDE